MATENRLLTQSLPASGDLSASQYCAIKIDTNGRMAVAGVDDPIQGILQDNPAAIDRAGNFAYSGKTKWRAGGVIAKGSRVTTDSVGRCITLASGSAWSGGTCVEAASAADQVIGVILQIIGAEVSTLPT